MPELFGVDYFRLMYVILSALILFVTVFYFIVDDDYKNLLFYQGVLATCLFGILLWFESALKNSTSNKKADWKCEDSKEKEKNN